MGKNKLYLYNAETDNFERFYPTFKSRLASWCTTFMMSLILAVLIFIIVFFCFDVPTLDNLRKENKRLKTSYTILNKRLDNSLKVMDNIRDRDDNFYRVIMQMEPLPISQRFAGLDNEENYRQLKKLSDSRLVEQLSQRMDLLEQQIYAQVRSFDQLKSTLSEQTEKLAHIPSVIPINVADYTMSSGYGFRIDPIYGSSKFHEGLDFAASVGTNVFATADGQISLARREAGYGNCIDIDHGFNYLSRYAHLSEILVKEGEKVKRGQLIGKVGSTGKSTGPHLHYEVRFKDEPQNPINYYFMDLSPEEYAEMIQMAENAAHVMD